MYVIAIEWSPSSTQALRLKMHGRRCHQLLLACLCVCAAAAAAAVAASNDRMSSCNAGAEMASSTPMIELISICCELWCLSTSADRYQHLF